MMASLPNICSFWHGPLSYLGQLCLASFVEKGHRVTLFSYGALENVPDGVESCDAEGVLPRERLFFYKGNRTPAVFADLFRLQLMVQQRGIWVDADVYCIKPYQNFGDYVFGYENTPGLRNGFKAQINQAVFACPPSPLLDKMLEVFTTRELPPGMPFWRALEVRARRAMGEELPVHHMQFGATGPMPLNYWVPKLGLTQFVQAKDVFYPLDYGRTEHLLAEGSRIADHITSETLSVHIWNSALTGRQSEALRRPHPDSFLGKECKRLQIDV